MAERIQMTPVRVLIVHASATVRQVLAEVLTLCGNGAIDVMGTAPDPFVAARKIAAEVPDVIVLDTDMPRMDGMTFLHKIMDQHPIPVLVCLSRSLAETVAEQAQAYQRAGAVGVLLLPDHDVRAGLMAAQAELVATVQSAAAASLPEATEGRRRLGDSGPSLSADVILPAPRRGEGFVMPDPRRVRQKSLVCLGASTGGTESLRQVLEALPAEDCPPILAVQHMPAAFTGTFARRLDSLCRISVREARSGDLVQSGVALLAPGDQHLLLVRRNNGYQVELREGPLVSRHRPSVDVLFRSAARAAGAEALGILLTGMGGDGAQGLLEMRQAGAFTIAEDESTCVVFGMPRTAIELGAACQVLPLPQIAARIMTLARSPASVGTATGLASSSLARR